MSEAPRDGTPIIVYLGDHIPYIAFVFWDNTPKTFAAMRAGLDGEAVWDDNIPICGGKGVWMYCDSMYADNPNYLVSEPSAWSPIYFPTNAELNAIAKANKT